MNTSKLMPIMICSLLLLPSNSFADSFTSSQDTLWRPSASAAKAKAPRQESRTVKSQPVRDGSISQQYWKEMLEREGGTQKDWEKPMTRYDAATWIARALDLLHQARQTGDPALYRDAQRRLRDQLHSLDSRLERLRHDQHDLRRSVEDLKDD